MPFSHLIVASLISVIGNMSNIIGTSMDYTDIRYGILLSSGQLDFLRDDCQGFHRSEALATFVKMAAIEPMHYEKKNFTAEIGIGQFVASTVELAKLWGCDRKTASKVVRLFNEMGILSSEANNRTTVHTIPCLAFWLVKVNGEEKTVRNPSEANNRTTVHTIPCLAFWLVKVNGEEKTVRNPHYLRAPQSM